MRKKNVLFGPIISRRLGLSLGINLIPNKTCNLNCIYCEVGHTTHFVRERKEYFSTDLIIEEIKDFLESYPNSQHIKAFTFSGAGEPTLASNLGEVIQFLKTLNYQAEIVVITNSLMFKDKEVFQELLATDRVMPSLDAATQRLFQKIDRGVPEANIEDIIDSLAAFRKAYKGKIDLEIFLASESQLEEGEIEAYKKAIEKIKPDSIDVNVLDRPGAVKDLEHISKEVVERFKKLINFKVINQLNHQDKNYSNNKTIHYDMSNKKESCSVINAILEILDIRPSTLDHLVLGLSISKENIQAALSNLIEEKKITKVLQEEVEFYMISSTKASEHLPLS